LCPRRRNENQQARKAHALNITKPATADLRLASIRRTVSRTADVRASLQIEGEGERPTEAIERTLLVTHDSNLAAGNGSMANITAPHGLARHFKKIAENDKGARRPQVV
jgi:hypothetical protein